MKRFFFVSLLALVLGGGAARQAAAQFIGYNSPQTVSEKLLAASTGPIVTPNSSTFPCTPTAGTPCAIQNLGQAIHAVTYTIASPCLNNFSMDLRLEGSNDGVTFFSISEDAVDQSNNTFQGSINEGAITAIGSYPVVRLNLAKFSCGSGSPTISAFYSGTWASQPTNTGIYYQSQPYRKLVVENLDTSVTQPTITFGTPTGNIAGVIYVLCYAPTTGAAVNCPAGGGVQVIARIADSAGVSGSITIGTFSVASTSNVTQIRVPIQLASSVAVVPTPTGTPGTNWSIFYQFDPFPGASGSGTSAQSVQTTGADPCQSTSVFKTSAVINDGAASTQQIVAPNGQKIIWVCGFALSQGAAGTFQFIQGTGGSCGGSTTNLSGAFPSATGTPFSYGGAGIAVMTAVSGNGLCIVTTGAGATAQGVLTYVQQ